MPSLPTGTLNGHRTSYRQSRTQSAPAPLAQYAEGKQFDAIAAATRQIFRRRRIPTCRDPHHRTRSPRLPGYYRPQKQWDVVIAHENTLVAAFELKALGAPSFGNNYNNRVEEALGSAVDIRRAALENLYPGEKPWLGYFFIMEDAPGSRRPNKTSQGSFAAEPIWNNRSHQERFAIFCRRLMAEGLYDAICYITSSPKDPGPNEPAESLDWRHFAAAINARLKYLADLGLSGESETLLF